MKLEELKAEIVKAQSLRDDESMDKEYGDSHRSRWDQYKERRDELVSEALISMTSLAMPYGCGDITYDWLETLLTLYTR